MFVQNFIKMINIDTTTSRKALPALIAIGIPITALYVFRWWADKKKLPPLVPYVFPILGSSIVYSKDPRGFVKRATEKYGSTFRFFVNGRIQNMVGKDYVRTVVRDNSFDHLAAVYEVFDFDTMLHGYGKTETTMAQLHHAIANHITPYIKYYTPLLLQKIEESEKRWLGDADESITLDDPFKMIQDMIANSSAAVFIGKDLCKNNDFVHTCKTLQSDINKIIGMGHLFLIPTLAILYQKFLFVFMNPTSRHLQVIFKAIGPEVEHRVREAREQGKAWDRPQDVLQGMIEMHPPTMPTSHMIHLIGHNMIALMFASVHNTSIHTLFTIYALADHQEYIDELLEEQEAVLAEEETEEAENRVDFSPHALKKMVKLDSFLHEALRFSEPPAILIHKNTRSEDLQLADGTVIGKGEHVWMNGLEIYNDESLQGPNPELFNPWRFLNKSKPLTKVSLDFLKFGLGKHSCPGRFLAVHEMKTIAALLIRKYRISRPENGTSMKDSNTIVAKGPLVFTKKESYNSSI